MTTTPIPLGPLQDIRSRLETCAAPVGDFRHAMVCMLHRMAEIDATVTTSLYRDLKPGEQDEPPDGDTYNLLWDAMIDEIEAVLAKESPTNQEDR